MLRQLLPLVLTPCFVLAAEPQQSPKLVGENDAKQLIEKALTNFVSERYKEGFEDLAPYWKLPKNEIDMLLMQTISQRSTVKPRYGSSLGFEMISKNTAGSSFLKFVYIEKLQNTAVRYTFVFYRPKDSWELQAMLWDDKINLLFCE